VIFVSEDIKITTNVISTITTTTTTTTTTTSLFIYQAILLQQGNISTASPKVTSLTLLYIMIY
jgi:hypothetical protein